MVVKPDRIYNADGQERINALVQSNADLSDTLTQERLVLSRAVYELTTQLEAQKEENRKLQRHLEQAQEILLDKDELIRERDEQIASLQARIAGMQEKVDEGIVKGWQLAELKGMLFGKRSERFVPAEEEVKVAIQQTFGPEFDSQEVEAILVQPSKESARADAQQAAEKTSRHNKRHKAHKGRRPIPSHIETHTIVVDTPGDKTGYKNMGIKKSVYYDYLPGKIIKVVEEHPQYISEDGETILPAAPVKPRMVERGTVGNTLLAYMHTERFVYYVPYYRQLQRFERNMALSFAASTVDHWEEVCYQKLKRLMKPFKRLLEQAGYIKADETTLKYVNDVGKGKASNGWLWVFLAPEIKLILFEFSPSRGHEVPKEILKNFKGTLQADGYSAYGTAFNDNEDVTLMGCLVHIRRGFDKAKKQDKALAEEALTLVGLIYKSEQHADDKKFNTDQRLVMRQKYARPILEKLKTWLEEQQHKNLPPDTPIVKAVNYALNQWDRLRMFLEDGKIDPDNNSVERAIRPVTLFRKNSLFAGNEHGGERAALFYSLVESCKLNGIDPFEYLQDIYERLYDCPASELIQLLPPYWKPTPKETSQPAANS